VKARTLYRYPLREVCVMASLLPIRKSAFFFLCCHLWLLRGEQQGGGGDPWPRLYSSSLYQVHGYPMRVCINALARVFSVRQRPLLSSQVPVATPETAEETKGAVVVIVNDKAAVLRDMNDAYGRAVTPFRRSHTQRDTRPLPLRGEDRKAEEWRLERQQRRLAEEVAESRDTCSGAPVVKSGTT